jgi:sigma-54 dependent transcriptional regulator, acetoin dehydrogenase operon transcriptional activator AcoR
MPRPDRSVLVARERFLETGDPGRAAGVRPEIVASWQRCRVSGVDPTDSDPPPFTAPAATDRGLLAAADEVLGAAAAQLGDTSTSLFLSDHEGRLLRRWADGSSLNRRLDRVYGAPGFTLDESRVGTNAIGTVYETGVAAEIRGGEHYLDRFLPFACVGVPIHHPVHRRLIGVLDASCRVEDGNTVLLPWATALVRDIERWLAERSSRPERLLLDRFRQACATPPPRPTLCLNERTVISNPAAARLLGGTDQALLWEQAARTVEQGRATSRPLVVGEREFDARYRPVLDGGRVVGAVVQLVEPRPAVAAAPEVPPLPGFVARCAAMRQAVRDARAAHRERLPLLVRGESGTGKLALPRALHAGARPECLDAALIPVDGPAAWLSAVRCALGSGAPLVVRHVEQVPPALAVTLGALLDAAPPGTRLAATALAGDVHPALLARLGVVTVELPPLRDRTDELPELLRAIGQRVGGARRTWSPEAVQVLTRAHWPGNVRQLEAVVRAVLATRPAGPVRSRDLPEELRTPPRRRLSRLDRTELSTITETLRHTRGNKLEAAALLGVSRSTLYRKLRSYGIDLDSATF